MINLSDVSASYGAVQILHGVNLHVGLGETVALLGANGAGKTTLLSSIFNYECTVGGKITIGGRDVQRWRTDAISRLGLSLVPEGRGTFSDLTSEENLEMGFSKCNRALWRGGAALSQAMSRIYDYFPVLHTRRLQQAGTLSGGEQQMLAIGRALISNPRVLLLDEPSLGLAPQIVAEIFGILENIREKEGIGILLVEQNSKLAMRVSDRGYVLVNGRIVSAGSIDELARDPRVARAYLGL